RGAQHAGAKRPVRRRARFHRLRPVRLYRPGCGRGAGRFSLRQRQQRRMARSCRAAAAARGRRMSALPFLPYGRQTIEEDDVAAVVEALRDDFLTTGPRVAAFETAFAEAVGT